VSRDTYVTVQKETYITVPNETYRTVPKETYTAVSKETNMGRASFLHAVVVAHDQSSFMYKLESKETYINVPKETFVTVPKETYTAVSKKTYTAVSKETYMARASSLHAVVVSQDVGVYDSSSFVFVQSFVIVQGSAAFGFFGVHVCILVSLSLCW